MVTPASGDGSQVSVTVHVANTGSRAGAEAAQLYVGFPSSAGEPLRQLKGFKKTTLQPGAGADLTFELDSRAFSRWDETAQAWVVEKGVYQIMVGSSSRDIRGSATFTVP